MCSQERVPAAQCGRGQAPLALWLFACGLLLAVPIRVLLLWTYQQFRNEAFYRYQTAIELVNRRRSVLQMLKPEAERPFDHYSFWSVPQTRPSPNSSLNVSPLAQLALKTTVPGVIRYFRDIDPDGSFHSPVLPELERPQWPERGQDKPLSHDEVDRRVALKAKLQALLNQGGASLAEEPEAEPALRGAEASDRASTPQESAKVSGLESRRREYC